MITFPYTELALGAIGLLLFRLRNNEPNFENGVSIAVSIMFMSEFIFLKTNVIIGMILWIFAGLALMILYVLRFRAKKYKAVIDFLKLFAIALLAAYPLGWALLANDWWGPISYLTIPMSGIIYFYDRWILKLEKMKKKFVVILIVQTIIMLCAFVYAFMQNVEVGRLRRIADETVKTAIEEQRNCETQMHLCEQELKKNHKLK